MRLEPREEYCEDDELYDTDEYMEISIPVVEESDKVSNWDSDRSNDSISSMSPEKDSVSSFFLLFL